jgi:restriction system protein
LLPVKKCKLEDANVSRSYYRVRLGEKAVHAAECFAGGFIGVHWGFKEDLSAQFGDDWRDFNARFRPVYLKRHPKKSMVAAGLACGMLWTFGHGMSIGDVVLCPDANGDFMLGEVCSDYYCASDGNLPQRRRVTWFPGRAKRSEVSEDLKKSTNGPGTVVVVDGYGDEIERLIGNDALPAIIATSDIIEDPSTFALEKHLEDFLVANWSQTELGRDYDIYREEGELIGQQYPSDTGPIDILAISKDRKTLLVVELKRGRASDVVVGQIQRYMGFVQGDLAEAGQAVRGAIIALEDDLKLRRALSVTVNIDFYRYQVSFRLMKV